MHGAWCTHAILAFLRHAITIKNSFSAIIVTGQYKNELLYANGTRFCELPDFPELRFGHSQA